MRVCSRKRPTIERTRMFSDSPGTPGRSAHTPRTIRSIFTPGLRGRVERRDDLGLEQRVHLGDDARRLARLGDAALRCWIAATTALVQRERRLPQVLQLARLAEAGELLEHLVHVGADLLVAR